MEKDCGIWISILSHKLKKRMNEKMQALGLTGVQSRVMHYILVKCIDGQVFQRDIEKAFGLSRSTATGILKLMEKNGLIQRESVASDARLKSLIPTEKAAHLDAQVREDLPADGDIPYSRFVQRTDRHVHADSRDYVCKFRRLDASHHISGSRCFRTKTNALRFC